MGGDGVVSVASNEIPGEMAALCAAAFGSRWDEARRVHERWLPLMRANFQGAPSPVPVKAALMAMGILASDTLRAPMLALDDAPRARLQTVLRDLALVDILQPTVTRALYQCAKRLGHDVVVTPGVSRIQGALMRRLMAVRA